MFVQGRSDASLKATRRGAARRATRARAPARETAQRAPDAAGASAHTPRKEQPAPKTIKPCPAALLSAPRSVTSRCCLCCHRNTQHTATPCLLAHARSAWCVAERRKADGCARPPRRLQRHSQDQAARARTAGFCTIFASQIVTSTLHWRGGKTVLPERWRWLEFLLVMMMTARVRVSCDSRAELKHLQAFRNLSFHPSL